MSFMKLLSRSADGFAPIKAEFLVQNQPQPTSSAASEPSSKNAAQAEEPALAAAVEVAGVAARAEAQPPRAADHAAADLSAAQAPTAATAPLDDGHTSTNGAAPSQQSQKEDRPSGRAAKRKKPLREGERRMCHFILNGKECPFGDKCKYVHDEASYLETKLEELPGQCPTWRKQGGKCRCGVTCRFAASHVPMSEEEIRQEKVADDLLASTERNALSDEARRQLRRGGGYQFPKATAFTKALKAAESTAVPGEQFPQITLDAALVGAVADGERKKIDWRGKTYLAPLTTVGNLPFRRMCKGLGADITCGEMAFASKLLDGSRSEWALVRRHADEDIFGVQICGYWPEQMAQCAEMLCRETDIDFIDLNCGCPIDLVFKQGCGSALMNKTARLNKILQGMVTCSTVPITCKLRTGVFDDKPTAHKLMKQLTDVGVSMITIHGRSREQRYSRLADWDYIGQCVKQVPDFPVFGNGDIMSFEEANVLKAHAGTAGVMVARGALHKPWVFTEIKEQRHWDISASERLDLIKTYVSHGLEHWGSDLQGVEQTRSFLLEWLSFAHRYIPVGLLEVVPQRINEAPKKFVGRNDLETLLASRNPADWVKISEMVIGPTPPDYVFTAKHKANAYTGEPMAQG